MNNFGVLIVGCAFAMMGYIIGKAVHKKEPVPCNCKPPTEIILLYEKKSRWIDAMTYPNHQLTKQEKDSLIDSITFYNNLLK